MRAWTRIHNQRWERARARLGESLAVPDADELGLGDELIHLLIRETAGWSVSPTPSSICPSRSTRSSECWVR